MSTPQPSSRVTISRFPVVALLVVSLAHAAGASADAGDTVYEVRVLQVWAGGDPQKGDPPAELKAHLEELRKRTGEKSFRLAAEASSSTLSAGKTLSLDLPSGYRAEWTVEEGGLRQTLTNPQKKQSSLLLKRSPVFTGLKKIRPGNETFQLVVEFRRRER